MRKIKLWEIIMAVGLVSALLLVTGAAAGQEAVADQVIRLHVVANSDSDEDQSLKLAVRDKILEEFGGFADISSVEEAEKVLKNSLTDIENCAAGLIEDYGFSYSVSAQIEVMDFPTRDYGEFALPAGEYTALRVVIGEGSGQNWWCVVFPPLCVEAAQSVSDTARQAGLGDNEIRLITSDEPDVQFAFKTLEIIEDIRSRMEK